MSRGFLLGISVWACVLTGCAAQFNALHSTDHGSTDFDPFLAEQPAESTASMQREPAADQNGPTPQQVARVVATPPESAINEWSKPNDESSDTPTVNNSNFHSTAAGQ
ncbi:MAG: hypothetical protein O3A00_04305 [Planctomycetota bacterium]|nr:hypothetical protein [Planctomycetota bacterium]